MCTSRLCDLCRTRSSAPLTVPSLPGHLGPSHWDSQSAAGKRPNTLHFFTCLLPSASSGAQLSPAGAYPQPVSLPAPPTCHCCFQHFRLLPPKPPAPHRWCHGIMQDSQTTSSAEPVFPGDPRCCRCSPSSCLPSPPPVLTTCPHSFAGTPVTQMSRPVPWPCVSPPGLCCHGGGTVPPARQSTVIATSKVPTHLAPRG